MPKDSLAYCLRWHWRNFSECSAEAQAQIPALWRDTLVRKEAKKQYQYRITKGGGIM